MISTKEEARCREFDQERGLNGAGAGAVGFPSVGGLEGVESS